MSEPAVIFDHVWKKFRRGERHDSLRDAITSFVKRPFQRRPGPDELADQEFWSLKDVSFEVKPGEALGIIIEPSAGGHGGTFIPEGIRWVVERWLAWMSRYRRLNTIFERTEGHLVAFIEIAFISILSRRLVRLVTQQISA